MIVYRLSLHDRDFEREPEILGYYQDPGSAFAACFVDPAEQAQARRRFGLNDSPEEIWEWRIVVANPTGAIRVAIRHATWEAPWAHAVTAFEVRP